MHRYGVPRQGLLSTKVCCPYAHVNELGNPVDQRDEKHEARSMDFLELSHSQDNDLVPVLHQLDAACNEQPYRCKDCQGEEVG